MNSLHAAPSFSPTWAILVLLAIVAFFLVVNGLIIWAVWRAVKKPASAAPAAGGAPGPANPPGGAGRALAIVAGVLLLCLAVPVGAVFVAFVAAAASRTTTMRHASEIRKQAQAAQRDVQERLAELPVSPLVLGATAEPLETRVLALRHARADDIHATLRQQREVWLAVEPRTNSVLLTAKPARLDELQGVIAQLDRAGPEDRPAPAGTVPPPLAVRWPLEAGPLATRVFPLAHDRAANLSKAIGTLAGMQSGGLVSVDTRANALVITAGPGYLDQFQLLIGFLDRPLADDGGHGHISHEQDGHGPDASIISPADPAQVAAPRAGAPVPPAPPLPAASPATLAEITAAAGLDFQANRLNALTAIARRGNLTPAEQVALANAALASLDFEAARLSLLTELINNPSFSEEARRAVLENLNRLQFESSRLSVLDQLNRKPASHGH